MTLDVPPFRRSFRARRFSLLGMPFGRIMRTSSMTSSLAQDRLSFAALPFLARHLSIGEWLKAKSASQTVSNPPEESRGIGEGHSRRAVCPHSCRSTIVAIDEELP